MMKRRFAVQFPSTVAVCMYCIKCELNLEEVVSEIARYL